jgi:fatty-acyl-CoA synthase
MRFSTDDNHGPAVIVSPRAFSSKRDASQGSGVSASQKLWLRALKAASDLGEHSPATLPALIEDLAARLGGAPAAMSRSASFSFRQVAELSNRYSRWALAEGVQIGDVVGLLVRNTPEYLAIWLGVTRVGGVVALLDPGHAIPTLARCVQMVAPSHLITDAAFAATCKGVAERRCFSGKMWTLGASVDGFGRIDEAVQSFPDGRLDEDERRPITLAHRALHICTRGATGVVRAANVSHHRIMTWCRLFAAILKLRPSDRLFHCLPPGHGIAGVAIPGAALASGASIFMHDAPSLGDFWADVRDSQSTVLQYDRELCPWLLDAEPTADERSHRLRMCCGSGIGGDVWKEFKDRFRIPSVLEFYAPAEGTFFMYNIEQRVGSVGRPPPHLSRRFPVTLVRLDGHQGEPLRNWRGHCVKVDVNEIGEALARVDMNGGIFGRYEGYASDEDTERKILRNVFAPGDVWYRSGDLMRVDAHGYFHFVDRASDIVSWKGGAIATSEIAAALARCAGVRRAQVYAVGLPQVEDRAPMAALDVDETFDLAAFRSQMEAALPDFAQPAFLRLRGRAKKHNVPAWRRSALIAEAFDPARVADPLFFDDRQRGAYVPVDAALFQRLAADGIPS